MVSKTYGLFGSKVEFNLDADESMSELILEDAYNLSLKLQKIFNIYDEFSELSSLNKNRVINASPQLIDVLKRSLELCELSNGEYDVSKGKQFLNRKNKKKIMGVNCSYKNITIRGNKVTLTHADVLVDLGSIAKGYIADQIASFFIEQGIESGYIDARGDLRVFGDERIIGIQHPRKKEILLSIKVKNKGVATSGDYNQYDETFDASHILNQKDIISATVVADDLTIADAYATVLMVCDSKIREQILKNIKLPTLIIDKNLNIKYYNGIEKMVIHEN